MSMKAEIQEIGNVTVVRVRGKITIGEGDIKLRETIEGLLGKGTKNILLDLGNVSFMDSLALCGASRGSWQAHQQFEPYIGRYDTQGC